jgi:hypothetical protein
MAYFDLSQYETVDSRIHRFWETYPAGRIHTEIVLINEKEVVIKASIFDNRDDPRPVSIDFAQESVTAKGVNATSWVENCATSAIGRALATFSFSAKGSRPSREEMTKAAGKPQEVIPAKTDAQLIAEATTLAAHNDLEGLRRLYAQAERSKVATGTLEAITEISNKMKARLKEEAQAIVYTAVKNERIFLGETTLED